IHRAEQSGAADRRTHRPHHARSSFVRRPAPGDRGQRRLADPGREPDPGLDHLPELLPPVQQAVRYDRYRGYRSVRVPADLRLGGDRGPDILLGGNWEVEVANLENATPEQIAQIKADWQKRHQQVIESGGLHVIASERHESRRIDNQLRGRSGRQGDPGSSRFYLSLEDSLMRIFASDRVKNFMKALGMQPGEAIEHRMVTNAIEKAQRKVEGRNFDIRKQLLEFDDVANEQRKVIYHMRNTLLAADDIGE